jgi:DNA polymerase-3 subunit delta'
VPAGDAVRWDGQWDGQWNIVGHAWAVEFLRQALARGSLSHAYLFIGPPQVGKRTLALEFARALLCAGESRPCGDCRPCQLVARGVHPDVRTVRGEGAKKAILVEQVRELRREAGLTPVEGRRRIYIICGMEFANESASNALLKTLEEPPPHATFLLTTTSEDLVTPTIVSRCQAIRLQPQPRQLIETALRQRWQVPAGEADLYARLSGGRMGRALSLLRSKSEPEGLLKRRSAALDLLRAALGARWDGRFDLAGRLARSAEQLPETLEIWASWWRDLLLVKQNLDGAISNVDRQNELRAQAGALDAAQAGAALAAVQACADHLQRNVNTRLALERLMLQLPAFGGA